MKKLLQKLYIGLLWILAMISATLLVPLFFIMVFLLIPFHLIDIAMERGKE